jgi:hypothetical protein
MIFFFKASTLPPACDLNLGNFYSSTSRMSLFFPLSCNVYSVSLNIKKIELPSELCFGVITMKLYETIEAWGHPNVSARNLTTFEVTKETYLTRKGDCILAINASKAVSDLHEAFKQLVRREDAKITVIVEVGTQKEITQGRGDPRLTLSHPTDLVIRKSNFISDRTLLIGADKAAINFSRNFIKELRSSTQKVLITLIVEV